MLFLEEVRALNKSFYIRLKGLKRMQLTNYSKFNTNLFLEVTSALAL